MKKLLEKIFSLKTENEHKILTILGIKIRFIYNNTLGIKNDTSEIKNILCSIQSDITALQSDSTKIKNDISKINTLNNTGWLGLTEKAIAEYILNSPTYGSDLQNLLECFDSDDKTKIISDLNNIYVRYKSNGKITFHDLIDTQTKLFIEKRDKYMSQKVKNGDYWQLDNYKLPVDFFLSEVLYSKLGLDDLNKDIFNNRDIIDAGACIGDSALVLSDYTSKKVYAFEPGEKNFSLMEKTIELNQKHNIVPVKCGLGDKEETLFLNENFDSNNIGGAYISDGNIKNGETAYIIPLDKYVKENNLDVGLIKIDVEGFEQNVLNGAYETIKRCHPTLLVSIYHKPEDFFKITPMLKHWNLNYKFKFLPQYSYNNFITETTVIAEPV